MPELPPASEFARKLAGIAEDLFQRFHTIHESQEPLRSQILKMADAIGNPITDPSTTAWSAIFVSFCVKSAGATADEFKFSAQHSVFVHKAIQNALASTGVFRGVPITAESVRVGDIIQNNRGGNSFDFDFARTHTDYISHSAIVVSRGEGPSGKFAVTVGGNESDSIREHRVPLHDDGTIVQRPTSSFICLIKNLK